MNQENGDSDNDPVIAKHFKAVFGKVTNKRFDGENRYNQSDYVSNNQVIDFFAR